MIISAETTSPLAGLQGISQRIGEVAEVGEGIADVEHDFSLAYFLWRQTREIASDASARDRLARASPLAISDLALNQCPRIPAISNQ